MNTTNIMLELLLIILATYGISHMVALEDGPFDIFSKFREKIGVEKQSNWIQRGFGCPMCISVWVSLFLCIVLGASWIEWIAVIGAIRIIHLIVYK